MASRPIVLVDDNPQDLELTLTALRALGLGNEIVTFTDGAQLLDYLHGRNAFAGRPALLPAVVLLDLKMPRVSGFDALRQLRQQPEWRYVPVVIFTSSREERDVVSGYDLGANAYVVKPVDFGHFTDTITRLGRFWAAINEPPPAATSA